MASVRMPDGQIINNVPDGIDQETLLQMYSQHKAAKNTYEPSEPAAYSAEGIPLITPSNQAAPENMGAAGTASKVASDIVSAPIRASLGAAEPFANIANLAGYSEPKKALQQMDVGIKEQGPTFLGVKSPVSSTANLAGEFGGANALLGGISKAATPIKSAVPSLKSSFEAIKSSPLTQSILGGAALGAAGSESGSPMDIAKEAGIGGVAGVLGHGIATGIGKLADPELLRLAKLKAQGILPDQLKDLSLGQLLGGGYQKLENFLADIPLTGAKAVTMKGKQALDKLTENNTNTIDTTINAANTGLKNAKDKIIDVNNANLDAAHRKMNINQNALHDTLDIEQDALHRKLANDLKVKHDLEKEAKEAEHAKLVSDLENQHNALLAGHAENESKFHVPMINKALESLNITVPENLKGREAIKWAQDKISETYNKALPKLSGIDIHAPEFTEKLDKILEKYKPILSDEHFRYLRNDANALKNSANPGEGIDPQKWQANLSNLSEAAHDALTGVGATVGQKKYGTALKDLKNEWMDLIEGKVGSEEFKAANKAHSLLQAPQKASTYIKNIGSGEFNPKDLVQAIKSSISEKRFAGGENEIQKMAEDAYNTLKQEKNSLKEKIGSDLENFKQSKKAEKDALAKAHEAEKKQLEEKKIADKIKLQEIKTKNKINLGDQKIQNEQNLNAKNKQISSNAESQIRENEIQGKIKKNAFKEATDEAKSVDDPDSYLKRRLGFMVGAPALGIGGYYGGLLNPAVAAALSGGVLAGSRLLHTDVAQNALKKAAMAERPEMVRQAGKVLKETAPLSGLAAVEAQQQYRQNKDKK